MLRSRLPRRVAAWLAVLAVMLSALAPAVSSALRADAGHGLTEICTAFGPRWVGTGDDASGPAGPGSLARVLEHCPYCSAGAQMPALPCAPAAGQLRAALLRVERPLPTPAALPDDLAEAVAQPRAPPRFLG